MSVASVTVAHNEVGMLPCQMDALLRQTRALDEIIVVDNASTDNTCEMLVSRYPQIKIIKNGRNLGVGGAASVGMAYAALEKSHDWIWIFDADSIPEPDTLQMLLDGLEKAKAMHAQVGIVSPLLIHRETRQCYPPLHWRDGFASLSRDSLRQPILFVDLLFGSGMLIRREVVQAVGLMREDMFMYFQDFEYCLRAKQSGFKAIVVTGARLGHEVGRARSIRLPGFGRLWPIHAPWQEYYMERNLVFAAWHLYSNKKTKAFALRHMARHAVGVLLFSPKKLACLVKMAQGFSDGRRGRLGVRFTLK